jgi:hypothetical protein
MGDNFFLHQGNHGVAAADGKEADLEEGKKEGPHAIRPPFQAAFALLPR